MADHKVPLATALTWVALAVMAAVLAMTLVACSTAEAGDDDYGRFVVERCGSNCYVVTDTETGEQWLGSWRMGLAPLGGGADD